MGVVASLIQSELIDLACEETDQALFFAHQAAKLQDLGYVASVRLWRSERQSSRQDWPWNM